MEVGSSNDIIITISPTLSVNSSVSNGWESTTIGHFFATLDAIANRETQVLLKRQINRLADVEEYLVVIRSGHCWLYWAHNCHIDGHNCVHKVMIQTMITASAHLAQYRNCRPGLAVIYSDHFLTISSSSTNGDHENGSNDSSKGNEVYSKLSASANDKSLTLFDYIYNSIY
ncbi:unnamed protein product [Medioppia subpectinata]|uniref:Uncharacterized protein n=1 Tax=Medioppia subpectinata TaxID=1979941 RepID=A0A7R9Q282_9ACAR|nr:unnamed protein product [Medioppia subpectinata]CAG2109857.1 unnamed protein product [Medioppia subpectinata]